MYSLPLNRSLFTPVLLPEIWYTWPLNVSWVQAENGPEQKVNETPQTPQTTDELDNEFMEVYKYTEKLIKVAHFGFV